MTQVLGANHARRCCMASFLAYSYDYTRDIVYRQRALRRSLTVFAIAALLAFAGLPLALLRPAL